MSKWLRPSGLDIKLPTISSIFVVFKILSRSPAFREVLFPISLVKSPNIFPPDLLYDRSSPNDFDVSIGIILLSSSICDFSASFLTALYFSIGLPSGADSFIAVSGFSSFFSSTLTSSFLSSFFSSIFDSVFSSTFDSVFSSIFASGF